jgi:hypothetical protein
MKAGSQTSARRQRRNEFQCLDALRVAVLVVDALEVIDVSDEHCVRSSRPVRSTSGARRVNRRAAIRHAGELIRHGQRVHASRGSPLMDGKRGGVARRVTIVSAITVALQAARATFLFQCLLIRLVLGTSSTFLFLLAGGIGTRP